MDLCPIHSDRGGLPLWNDILEEHRNDCWALEMDLSLAPVIVHARHLLIRGLAAKTRTLSSCRAYAYMWKAA